MAEIVNFHPDADGALTHRGLFDILPAWPVGAGTPVSMQSHSPETTLHVLTERDGIQTLSQGLQSWSRITAGVESTSMEKYIEFHPTHGVYRFDMMNIGNYLVVVWETIPPDADHFGQLWWCVYDMQDGTLLTVPSRLATEGGAPHIVKVNATRFIVTAFDDGAGVGTYRIRGWTFVAGTWTPTGPVTLVTNVENPLNTWEVHYDVVGRTNQTDIVLMTVDKTTKDIWLRTVNGSLTVTNTVNTLMTGGNGESIYQNFDDARIVLVWAGQGNVLHWMTFAYPALGTVAGPFLDAASPTNTINNAIGVSRNPDGSHYAAWSGTGRISSWGAALTRGQTFNSITGALTGTNAYGFQSFLYSKPMYMEQLLVPANHGDRPCLAVSKLDQQAPIAAIVRDRALGGGAAYRRLLRAALFAQDWHHGAYPNYAFLPADGHIAHCLHSPDNDPFWVFGSVVTVDTNVTFLGAANNGIAIYKFTGGARNHLFAARDVLVHGGGQPGMCDVNVHAELVMEPPLIDVVMSGGGGYPNIGSVDYALVWVYRDAVGNTWRSAPSEIQTLSVGTQDVYIDSMYSFVSGRAEDGFQPALLEVYASDYNAGGTGAPLKHLVTIEPGNNILVGSVQLIRTPLLQVTYGKRAHDPALSPPTREPLLYTSTGELPNFSAGPTVAVEAHAGRYWFISGDNRRQLRASKPFTSQHGIGFNARYDISLGEMQQDPIALASIGDSLLVFSPQEIVYVGGEVNEFGRGEFIGPRQLSASGVGCINKNTIVKGPFGVVFESERGIYLVNTGLQLEWIGQPVAVHAKEKTIIDAVLVPKRGWVVFSQTDRVLIWDYENKKWFIYDDVTQTMEEPIYGLFDVLGTYDGDLAYYPGGTGNIYTLTDTISQASFGTHVTTPWIKVRTLQGFDRIWSATLLGKIDGGDIKVEIGYDYDPAWTYSYVWRETAVLPGDVEWPNGDPLQLKIHLPRQKCQAIRFRISQVIVDPNLPPTSGQGLVLTGLNLKFGLKPDNTGATTFKLPETAKK